MTHHGFAGLLAATLLTACAPHIAAIPQSSKTVLPTVWRTALPFGQAVEAAWWRSFGDPQLDRLVDQARLNNPDVVIATERVREARAQERVSRSVLLPEVSFSGSGSAARTLNPFGKVVESAVVQPGFQASYELDLFGKNQALVDAARANIAASEAAREVAQLAVSSATATGYITLLALDGRSQVLRATLAARGEALRIARTRAQAGYTSQLELNQSEAEFRSTEQQLPALAATIARQENALSQLIGQTPRSVDRGKFVRLRVPAMPGVLPSELMRRRPDIAQAEFALAAADAQLGNARAQFLPQIRLSASAGALISSALPDPVSLWSLGGSILAPLFNGGRLEGQFDGATARRDQAAFVYRRTVLVAFREVEDQLALIGQQALQEQSLVAQRLAVSEALRHATNRYQAGYTGYIEQVDAQRALLAVDLALVQLRADRLTAYVALFQALGGHPS